MNYYLSLVLLLATFGSLVTAQLPRCGDFCTFHTCKANGLDTVNDVGPRILLRDANIATQPFVCRKIVTDPRTFLNQTIKVRKTGQAEVHRADLRNQSPRPFVRISKFRPSGLSRRFPKSYFTLREINRFPPIPGEVGLSRQGSVGNQEDFLDDLCLLVPIKSYDLLKDDGSLDRRVRRTNQREDCVSFRTVVPSILIELTWDSSDDLDLSVKEPNGNTISLTNTNSATGGRLIRDQNVGVCGVDPNGREQVRWLAGTGSPDVGKYRITVKHFKNCGDGPTKWSLAVIIRGKNVLFVDGVSDRDGNARITKKRFTFSA